MALLSKTGSVCERIQQAIEFKGSSKIKKAGGFSKLEQPVKMKLLFCAFRQRQLSTT